MLDVPEGVHKATSQTDVVDSGLVGARHTLPLRFEQNSLSLATASLLTHVSPRVQTYATRRSSILNDECGCDYEVIRAERGLNRVAVPARTWRTAGIPTGIARWIQTSTADVCRTSPASRSALRQRSRRGKRDGATAPSACRRVASPSCLSR